MSHRVTMSSLAAVATAFESGASTPVNDLGSGVDPPLTQYVATSLVPIPRSIHQFHPRQTRLLAGCRARTPMIEPTGLVMGIWIRSWPVETSHRLTLESRPQDASELAIG